MTLIETDQSRDIKLTEIARGPFLIRYLSYRKSEDAALNLRSEDYIVSEINPEKTVFGLCDGVGSSFYGNIGSQILGEILLNWLGKVAAPNNFDPDKPQTADKWLEKLTAELTAELNNRTVFATSVVQKKELTSQNEMVRMAESTQREDFGTQSNFACGIVWPASKSLPKGLVLLFWLGNARLRLFNQNKDLTSLLGWGKDPDQLLEVWSSKDGVIGRVYSFVTDLSKVTSIIAYSDGLENAEEHIRPNLDGERLEALVQHSQSIKDDDATFLELSGNNKEVPGLADDIVVPLRRQMQTAPGPAIHPRSPAVSHTPDPEVQKLRSQLDSLQKKYEVQARKSRPSANGILIAASLFFVVLCFFLGLIIGPKIKDIFTPSTATPTAQATATRFILPTRTFTSTVLPSITPTETIPSTPTVPTETPTVTPSETPTPTATPVMSIETLFSALTSITSQTLTASAPKP